MQNYRDEESFRDLVSEQFTLLSQYTSVSLAAEHPIEHDEVLETNGHDVLRIYFAQIMHRKRTILDVRKSRFYSESNQLTWAPRPIWLEWDEDFLAGVRLLYRGFYGADGDELMSRGLKKLNLQGFEQTVNEHFGVDNQRNVEFKLSEIQQTFQSLIKKAESDDRQLHHHFVGLGLYLVMLYDHLEQLGGTYDVRAVFNDVVENHEETVSR
jgi:hypothetical protein